MKVIKLLFLLIAPGCLFIFVAPNPATAAFGEQITTSMALGRELQPTRSANLADNVNGASAMGNTSAQDCTRYNPRRAKRLDNGQRGKVWFENYSTIVLTVKLYHPDGDGSAFASWSIKPGDKTNLAYNGENITVGSDWRIQVDESCVYLLRDIAQYETLSSNYSRFRVRSDRVR